MLTWCRAGGQGGEREEGEHRGDRERADRKRDRDRDAPREENGIERRRDRGDRDDRCARPHALSYLIYTARPEFLAVGAAHQ